MAMLGSAGLVTGSIVLAGTGGASVRPGGGHDEHGGTVATTTTPIKHLVVIFGENVSFDHYFGTYPFATNPAGEPAFTAAPGTPSVNNLTDGTGIAGPLLTSNPNNNPLNAPPAGSPSAGNPLRLDRSDAMTCDQNHGYTAEQSANDQGAMDLYPKWTSSSTPLLPACLESSSGHALTTNGVAEPLPTSGANNFAVMDYYDGNTVTALWNYAQHFSMSDNAYGTTYGPSTPGALNVTAAQTYGAVCGPSGATINDSPCPSSGPTGYDAANVASSQLSVSATDLTSTATASDTAGTVISDADPYFDVCSYLPKADGGDAKSPAATIEMSGPNIGTELISAGVTWGWFEGGFDNGYVPGKGTAPTTAQICAAAHKNVGGATVTDYIPHHEPFQYYASTANPMHLPPTSVAKIGQSDQANHQYDLADFWAAAAAGDMPAVSFLKAPAYQDAHAGYSDPLDEQQFLVDTINKLEKLPSWSSTAVVINYDDSDGWYDHVMPTLMTGSATAADAVNGPGRCGSSVIVPKTTSGALEQGKCGLGPRLPFVVISPYAKTNYVDHTTIDQSSIVRFIEDNWKLPALGNGAADAAAGTITNMFDFARPTADRLFLNDTTGEAQHSWVDRSGHGHRQQT